MSKPNVRYLVFDIESVADGDLVSKIRYPGQGLKAADAVRRYRDELMAKYETDFIPYTFQVPVSVVVAKVAADFSVVDIVALDEPQFRSPIITENFWRGWDAYRRPTLVSFNGRTFDLPLLELAAFLDTLLYLRIFVTVIPVVFQLAVPKEVFTAFNTRPCKI